MANEGEKLAHELILKQIEKSLVVLASLCSHARHVIKHLASFFCLVISKSKHHNQVVLFLDHLYYVS